MLYMLRYRASGEKEGSASNEDNEETVNEI